MPQVRQSIDIGVLLFGTDFLLDRKWIKYCICIFIAALFHKTAVFALTFFLLCIDVPKYVRLLLIILGFITLQFPAMISEILLSVSYLFPDKLQEMIVSYLSSDTFGGRVELGSGVYFFSRQLLVLIIILLYTPQNKLDVFVLNALVLDVLLGNVGLIHSIMGRIESYVGLYAIIGFTKLFEIRFIKEWREIFCVVFGLFIIYFGISFYIERTTHGISELTGRDGQYQYLPYYNVFFHPDGFYRKDWNE